MVVNKEASCLKLAEKELKVVKVIILTPAMAEHAAETLDMVLQPVQDLCAPPPIFPWPILYIFPRTKNQENQAPQQLEKQLHMWDWESITHNHLQNTQVRSTQTMGTVGEVARARGGH
jgi:hypothetical protein